MGIAAWNSLEEKLVLSDLFKKIVNIHNDGVKSLIPSLWTFIVFLGKSFRTIFLLVTMEMKEQLQ